MFFKQLKKKDRYNFIWEAIQKHGYKYNYSKVEYKGVKEKVCIVCPKHGEFWITPDKHINSKQGCAKCAYHYYDNDSFIAHAKSIHGDFYDYSKVNYIDSQTKVCIICPKHGEFWTMPSNHVGTCNKCGCYYCAKERTSSSLRKNRNMCIDEFRKIHGDKYDYSKIRYINNKIKICIICPKHGEFWQVPSKHLSGQGCPVCRESKLENDISLLLDEHDIFYEREKTFSFLKNGKGIKRLDFYLPDYNIAIECQGEQHFMSVKTWGGITGLKRRIDNDIMKYKLCLEHNIHILYIISSDISYQDIPIYNNDNVFTIKKLQENIDELIKK